MTEDKNDQMVGEPNVSVSQRTGFPKNVILLLVIVGIVAVFVAGYFLYERSQTVAVVNGERITKNDLYDTLLLYTGKDVLDDLIERNLILQESKSLKLTVSDEEMEEEMEQLKEWFETEEEFQEAMAEHGYTMERLRDDIRIDLLRRKLVELEIEVTDEALEVFFNEYRYLFDEQEQVNARHILVETEAEIEAIIRRLDAGEDFGDLARELSLDTFSKDEGGVLGFIQRNDAPWPELDDVAFSLEAGERSGPVESYSGFHIVEVLERKDPKEAVFAEIKDKVKETMLEEEMYEKMEDVMDKLYDRANIKNLIFND